MVDSKVGIEYSCERCTAVFKKQKWYIKHIEKCTGELTGRASIKEKFKTGIAEIDWVVCKICDKKATTLGKHLTHVHNITQEKYLNDYPGSLITCHKSADTFKKRGVNFAWLKRAKERGDDLTKYKQKMGKAVSDAVMANSEERARRANQMAINNRTPEARELSSTTAKKTSARPEIQKARAEKLTLWREIHFDEFYEKCIKAMHSTWHSKPELALASILCSMEGYSFKHNQCVKSELIHNRSKRKQIDVADKSARIYVEFDGIIHFEPKIKGTHTFEKIRASDASLNKCIIHHKWMLIRVSYDQFSYKNGGFFKKECLEKLFDRIKNPQPGVYKIGDAYQNVIEVSTECM